MSDPPRQAAVILGMHRSGTSALAGVLVRLGFAPPRTPLNTSADNPLGFYEPAPVVDMNYHILANAGQYWNTCLWLTPRQMDIEVTPAVITQIAGILESEFGAAGSFVLKDPRLCLTFPLWRLVLAQSGADIRVLLVLRHPAEVVASLAARNGFADIDSALLWLHHVLEAEAISRTLPRGFVVYGELLGDWRRALNRAAGQAGLRWPRPLEAGRAAVNGFLSIEARHHHAAPGLARLGAPPVGEMVEAAWLALNDLARYPGDFAAQARLDSISAQFARWRRDVLGDSPPPQVPAASQCVL